HAPPAGPAPWPVSRSATSPMSLTGTQSPATAVISSSWATHSRPTTTKSTASFPSRDRPTDQPPRSRYDTRIRPKKLGIYLETPKNWAEFSLDDTVTPKSVVDCDV